MNFIDIFTQTFKKIKANALGVLMGAIIVCVPIYLMHFSKALGILLAITIGGYLLLCASGYFLKLVRGQKPEISSFFVLDKTKIMPSVILGIMFGAFSGIWSLLLIIPGLYVFSKLSMSFHIMHEQNITDSMQCFKQSAALTKKNIWHIVIANGIVALLTIAITVIFLQLVVIIKGAVWYNAVTFNIGGILLIQLLTMSAALVILSGVAFMLTMNSVIYFNLTGDAAKEDLNNFTNYDVK